MGAPKPGALKRGGDRAPPLICLMGPTCAGKTDAALLLSQHLPVDVISVDSALVYRGMDIGTAKPGRALLERLPHRLIDIRDPDETYSAAAFRADARAAIADIGGRGRIPLLVGGTGLYFRALLQGLAALPGAAPALRARLDRQAGILGWPAMHRRLQQVDGRAAARIHPNDGQRIQRALEVYELTGRPLSEQLREDALGPAHGAVLSVVLCPERDELHRRIARRFRAMLAGGLVAELQGLRERFDLHSRLPSMRLVGYRQAWHFLEGEIGARELEARGIAATRQLCKRQITWLRAQPGATWIGETGPEQTEKLLKSVVDNPMLTWQGYTNRRVTQPN